MGNLHPGHLSLFNTSCQNNQITVASIFINPTQFNQALDFEHYPRTLNDDLALLASAGVHYCLLPDESFLYPDGYRYQVHETEFSQTLEGQQRPGHFTGVLTVVLKLFNLVQPHRAYFGEKDYQQFQLIREMAAAFLMDVQIIACPTVREPSGLAYSSRNNRLTPAQKKLAEQFAKIFHHSQSREQTIKQLEAIGIEVEYIENQGNRRFAAIKIGNIRLIDNYAMSDFDP